MRPLVELANDITKQYPLRTGAEVLDSIARAYITESKLRGTRAAFNLTAFGHALGLDRAAINRIRARAQWSVERQRVVAVGGKAPGGRRFRWVRDAQIVVL